MVLYLFLEHFEHLGCFELLSTVKELNLSNLLQQEDIRNYIDNSLKHGIQLSLFRKERFGGDSQGINYW